MPKPQRADTLTALSERSTSIAIPINVDLSVIKSKLDAAVPRRLVSIDENRDACVPAQWAKVCVVPKLFRSGCAQWLKTKITPEIDCHLSGYADHGDIIITASDNYIDVSMPINAALTVRGRGDIGKRIQETARASIIASARVVFDIDSDWNPRVSVTPDFSWLERAYIELLGIKVTLGDKVEPEIRKALHRFKQTAEASASGLDLKRTVEDAWKKGFETVSISTNPNVWLQFRPQELGISQIVASNQELRITVFAQGQSQAFVGPLPPTAEATELPPLQKELQPAHFRFLMPVLVDYDTASRELEKLLGAHFEQTFQVPGIGLVAATIERLDIYPTMNDQIAIGVTLNADPSEQFFDTRGTVWITAKIDINNDNRILTVAELYYGGETNNPALNLLIKIMQTESIRATIESALAYDFSHAHADALSQAHAALNTDYDQQIALSGKITSAGVKEIRASSQGIYMGLEIEGELEVHVNHAMEP